MQLYITLESHITTITVVMSRLANQTTLYLQPHYTIITDDQKINKSGSNSFVTCSHPK